VDKGCDRLQSFGLVVHPANARELPLKPHAIVELDIDCIERSATVDCGSAIFCHAQLQPDVVKEPAGQIFDGIPPGPKRCELRRIGVECFLGLSHGRIAAGAIGGGEGAERPLLLRGCDEQTMALIRIGKAR